MNYGSKKEGSMKRLHAFIFGFLLLTLASLLGACGGNTEGSSSTTTTPTATTPATTTPTTAAPQEVRVVMGEMYFKTPVTTFKVDQPYKFVLVNEGNDPHEFTIAPPRHAGQSHEDEDALALIHEDELGAGQSKTVEFTFKEPAPAGTLEIECSFPNHYEQGMRIPIVVER
jgi:uncharacterized cupredoxin-like copper-binding protein